MAAKKAAAQPSVPLTPRIYKALRGSLGRVLQGEEITETEAVQERRAGSDIVICGGILKANRRLARRIENTVGPCKPEPPHDDLGPYVLPHFQPDPRPPEGHSFYETEHRKAAKNP